MSGIVVSQIPECVLGPASDSPSSLRDWVGWINARATAELKSVSDDTFTEDEFLYARDTEWGSFLNFFSDFADFEEKIYASIQSQMDSPGCRQAECLKQKGSWRDDEGGGSCRIEPPKETTPKIPPPRLPSRPDRRPSVPKASPPPAWEAGELSLEKPPWWSRDAFESVPDSPSTAAASVDPKSFQVPSPFQAFQSEGPDKSKGNGPQINVQFDGKFFILDIHGCHVSASDPEKCVADWANFWLRLTNETSGQQAQKRADVFGWARIKVAAAPGDRLVFFGTDAGDGRFSLNRLRYEITPEGKIAFQGSVAPKPPKKDAYDQAADGIGQFLPQIGNTMKFLRQPQEFRPSERCLEP